MQMPNLALIETKHITMFEVMYTTLYSLVYLENFTAGMRSHH
jgi:hypothetical protein